MSDGSLSQDEIDALLQGGGGMDFGSSPEPAPAPKADLGGLSSGEKQEFQSLIEGMISSQASNLNNLINDTVELTNPVVEVVDNQGIAQVLDGDIVEINLDFSEGLTGKHSYLLDGEFAEVMAGLMMGMDNVELSEAAFSALGEAGNTLVGTAATVFGDKLGKTVMPDAGETRKVAAGKFNFQKKPYVKVEYDLVVDSKTPAKLVEVYDLNLVKQLVSGGDDMSMGGLNMADMASLEAAAGGGMGGGQGRPGMGQSPMGQMNMNTGMGMGMGGMQMNQGGFGGYMGMNQQANIQSIQFPGLNPQTHSGDQGNIGLLMDVYMEMTVELGRTKRLIKDILGMGEGTIIELDKLAGEPVDILVNHKLIAKGEVVVIDENFGVRVTEIVSPVDRMGEYT